MQQIMDRHELTGGVTLEPAEAAPGRDESAADLGEGQRYTVGSLVAQGGDGRDPEFARPQYPPASRPGWQVNKAVLPGGCVG